MNLQSLLPPCIFNYLCSNSNARFLNFLNHALTFSARIPAEFTRTIVGIGAAAPHQRGAQC